MERWSWTAALVLMAISDPRAVRADALTWSDGTFLNWSSYPYTVYIYDGDPSLFTENVSVGPDNHPEHGDILFHSMGTGGVGEVAVVSANNAFPDAPSTDGQTR